MAQNAGAGVCRRSWGNRGAEIDRKSTRLNSSHLVISDAVFCFKKKTTGTVVVQVRVNRVTKQVLQFRGMRRADLSIPDMFFFFFFIRAGPQSVFLSSPTRWFCE